MVRQDDRWWPKREAWPTGSSGQICTEEALALLILENVVVPLNGGDEGITVQALCNDLFYWGTADSQEIPPIGFTEEGDAHLLALYDAYREHGHYGASRWCCLQRGMRPQTPIERDWRKDGLWDDELEALPARDPEDCG